MKKNNHIVYKAQNKHTGEVYIGATTNSVKQRQLDHMERAVRGENNKFHEAISTFGPEAFVWTQIDTANTIDELARKEKKYIAKYNTMENGYNSDCGGGMQKSVYQYTIDGSLVNTFDGLDSAANAVSAHKTCVGNACTGQSKSCKGYLWTYSSTFPIGIVDERKKMVGQYDLENNLVDEFISVAEASKRTGISRTCISRCCRGERKQSGGFKWDYQNFKN